MSLKGELLQCLKILPGYEEYSERIQKTLYCGIPCQDLPSSPMTGLLVEKFNSFCKKEKLERLNLPAASSICYTSNVTPCSVIISLLYLDRLRKNNPEYLETASPFHVFLVSLMVASKYLYDDGEEAEVYNDEWAASADVLSIQLNYLEREFLFAIDWDLHVNMRTFLDALVYVEVEVAKQQAISRGFFTYTDLATISQALPPLWSAVMSVLSASLAVCFVTYAATIFSVTLGSLVAVKCNFYVTSEMQNLGQQNDVSQHNASDTNLKVQDLGLDEKDFCHGTSSDTKIVSEIDDQLECEINKNFTPPLPPQASTRFSTLRTLTAALILASSTSGQHSSFNSPYQHGHFLSSHQPVFSTYSLTGFRDDPPAETSSDVNRHPENIPGFLTSCWNCDLIHNSFFGNFCSNHPENVLKPRSATHEGHYDIRKLENCNHRWPACYLKEKMSNSKGQNGNAHSNLNDADPFEMNSMNNLTRVIFRSEFTSFTTGSYMLPSSRKLHLLVNEGSGSSDNVNFSACHHCLSRKDVSPLSNPAAHRWMESVMTFLHWKSLPVDGFDEFLTFEQLESPHRSITMPT